MISLILTILCSTSIALILKHNDTRSGSAIILLCGNYFVASLVSLYFLITADGNYFSVYSLIFGLFLGGLFVISFFAFARAVNIAGASLATVSSRLSVIVPLIFSIIIFKEHPNIYQLIGFAFTLLTIILFYKSLNNNGETKVHYKSYLYLIVVLLGIGVNDFCMKIFQEWRPAGERPLFMFAIFTSAFLLTLSVIIIRGIHPEKSVIQLGLLLGIPNMFSTFFMLSALAQLAAIIVYPVTNIGIILLTSLLALLIWKEKLNRFGQLALISGIIAIVLMGV